MTDFHDMTPEQRRAFWAKHRAEATERANAQKPSDAVGALLHEASSSSSRWAEQDGLYPKSYTEWGEPRYTVQQGLRAAHVGREDSAATLILMRPVLQHLRTILSMTWVVIGLLALILWRVW